MTAFTLGVAEGFAQLLADAGIGLAYNEDGDYTDDEVGIFLYRVPQKPFAAVTITPYLGTADPTQAQSSGSLQIRTRTGGDDPQPGMLIQDTIQNALLGLYPVTLPGGVRVTTLQLTASGPMGQDANNRWNFADTYRYSLYRPTAHRY